MTVNPCGHLVDYLRESTVDFIRPFRDSDITVRRRWFRVSESAPPLGFPSAFLSSRWEPFPYLERNVGDVWPSAPEYRKAIPLEGFSYEHVCGTAEDFAYGPAFDPAANVVYDSDWIPECCGRQDMCVFNLCEMFQLNGAPASQLDTFAIAHQNATPDTFVVRQQWAQNLTGSDPPEPGFVVRVYPAGTEGPDFFATQFSARADGTNAMYVIRVGPPGGPLTVAEHRADSYVIRSGPTAGDHAILTVKPDTFAFLKKKTNGDYVEVNATGDTFSVEVKKGADVGSMSLAIVDGVLRLSGTNFEIDPALLGGGGPAPDYTLFGDIGLFLDGANTWKGGEWILTSDGVDQWSLQDVSTGNSWSVSSWDGTGCATLNNDTPGGLGGIEVCEG